MRRRKPIPLPLTPLAQPAAVPPLREGGSACAAISTLIVAPGRPRRDLILGQLPRERFRAVAANGPDDAARDLARHDRELVLVLADTPGAWEFGVALARSEGAPAVVLIRDNADVEPALAALRAGVADVVPLGPAAPDFQARLVHAVERRRAVISRGGRVERLRRLCRKLNDARQQLSKQVVSLCDDLATAYKDLSDQIETVSATSEFNSLIRQELDIESLLRTALEFLLTKTGPTNAAVFLPAASGDFTLGAYVNYDGPKDGVEVMLEHLAQVVPARFEREAEMVTLSGKAQLEKHLGEAAHWLGDSSVLVFACRHTPRGSESECLAVVVLHRDRRSPFTAPVLATLRPLAELFAHQLARVIRVHHRHVPPSKWHSAWESQIDPADPDA